VNLDLFAHWLNSSDRSFAIQRLANQRWWSYHSENSSSFNTIEQLDAEPFKLNQWSHFAIARHLSGNVSFWIDGELITSGDPGINSYHDTFSDNPQPFKFVGNNSTDDGIKCYVGWAAMREDDVYGETNNITVPLEAYDVVPPKKVKAVAVGMTGSGHGGATWDTVRYRTAIGAEWTLPAGASLSTDPDTATYNGAISNSGFFLDQTYGNAAFTTNAFSGGLVAKQILNLAVPIVEPYEVSFVPYSVENGFTYTGVFIELIYEDDSIKTIASGQTANSVSSDPDASAIYAFVS